MKEMNRSTKKAIAYVVTFILAINSIFMFNCVLAKPSFNDLKFVDAVIFDDPEIIKQLKRRPYTGKIKV